MIHKCKGKCINKGQDALHGEGMRVLNFVPSREKGMDVYKCTVCKATHSMSEVARS